MKKSLSFAALAAVVLTGSAFAYSPKESAPQPNASCAKLVPSQIVNPVNLPLSFTRRVIEVEFSLDATGRPQDIKVVSNADRAVKEQVVKAFKQWKFEPTAPEAVAAGKRFVLPIDIVPSV